jgi:aminopeptidase-like protein
MQVFVLDKNPTKSAKMLCDKHVVKMVLESAQILSTVHYLQNTTYKTNVYAPTHIKHPCVIWANDSKKNYLWLLKHLKALLKEYTYRYNKIHKTKTILKYLKKTPKNLKNKKLYFVLAMPDKYKQKDVVKSYRDYYINEKKSFLKYTKRKSPFWLSLK